MGPMQIGRRALFQWLWASLALPALRWLPTASPGVPSNHQPTAKSDDRMLQQRMATVERQAYEAMKVALYPDGRLLTTL